MNNKDIDTHQFNACKRKINVIKTKYDQGIYLPSSVTCYCLDSSNSCSWKFSNGSLSTHHKSSQNTSTYKQIIDVKLKQYTNHWKIEIKGLKNGSTCYNDQNGTMNA